MKWDVYYNHAFYYDVIKADTVEEAKKIAVEMLRKDMPDMVFPNRVETIIGNESTKEQIVNCYEDFIEEVCKHEEGE